MPYPRWNGDHDAAAAVIVIAMGVLAASSVVLTGALVRAVLGG